MVWAKSAPMMRALPDLRRARRFAGAAAEVEDDGVFALQDWTQKLGGAGAPEAVELEREDVVEGVVAGGDLGEHFADFAGGVGFGLGAFGLGAAGGGVSGHGGGR